VFELHGSADPATLKLLVCLEELGLTYQFVSLDLQRLDQWAPAHRVRAPQGAVPVLIDGARVMDDAAIALLYLADGHPLAGLLPADPADHYDVQASIDVLDAALLANVNLIGWCRQQTDDARAAFASALAAVPGRPPVAGWSAVWRDAESDRLRRAHEKVDGGIVRIEQALATRPWLVGGALTAADINAFAMTEGLPTLLPDAVNPQRTPRVCAWLERLRSRAAVRRALGAAGRSTGTRYAPPQ
jgi:glutathione S-transferase